MKGARETVLQKIQELALAGIAAHGKVTETELARRIGVSRTPVREALARLMTGGILVRRQNVGIILKPPTSRDIMEFYEARAAIECAAARLTAKRLKPALKRRLLTMARTMDHQRISRGKRTHVSDRLDVLFHKSIVDACGNRHLQGLYQCFPILWLTMCFGHLAPPVSPYHVHESVAKALISGQAGRAEKALRFHICSGALKMIKRMKSSIGKEKKKK